MDHTDLYLIRNDRTGRVWSAGTAEARLYAVGGLLDMTHSVFERFGGSSSGLTIFDLR